MPIGNLAGRARVRLGAPSAQGECDRCGIWYQLDALRRQMQWNGAALFDTGSLVCRRCLDEPQQQNRTPILPPDPVPRRNPRVSQDGVSAGANMLRDGFGNIITDGNGRPISI